MTTSKNPECAICQVEQKACRDLNGHGPINCPTLQQKSFIIGALQTYEKPDVKHFAKMASIQEAECYANRDIKPYVSHPVKPRIQEICEFAQKMQYTKLGIAFCAGLHHEAQILSTILQAQGFEIVSVVCKVGCTPKEAIGVEDDQKIRIGEFEAMCSPIIQAQLLNAAKTDFNILLGLCVGHDSLFFKYSSAYTTVLVAKDRVLAHNPIGALYTTQSYYARMLRPGIDATKT
jgi:uncharacterized metal-binding protein